MQQTSQIWYSWLVEPFTWLVYRFVQPSRFKRTLEPKGLQKRTTLLLRLTLPMFLLSYLPACLLKGLLSANPDVRLILLMTALGTGLGITVGVAAGIVFNVAVGIVLSMALGMAAGIAVGSTTSMAVGIVLGTFFGIFFGSIGSHPRAIGFCIALGFLAGLVLDLTAMMAFSITSGILTMIIAGGSLRLRNIVAAGMVLGMAAGARGLSSASFVTILSFNPGAYGLGMQGLVGGLAFIASYILFAYRVPLYMLSALSMRKAYVTTQEHPPEVFTHLHRSALYWAENALPLSYVKRILLIATEQSVEKTLKEFEFILRERPQQAKAVAVAWLELIARDLEQYTTLHEIAQASQRLPTILPQDTDLISPQLVKPFVRLGYASRAAARYSNSPDQFDQSKALEEMITNLNLVNVTAWKDPLLNSRVRELVERWQRVAQQEQKRFLR
jgi:hypothetical protein